MSKTRIKPKTPNRHRKPVLVSGVSDDSPFAPLQKATLALADARTQTEKSTRVQGIFDLVKTFEAAYTENARQLGAAERALIQFTGGEFFSFQTSATIPDGTMVRVLDATGRECLLVDVYRGRFIRLPEMVDPIRVELKTPDGKTYDIVPGQPVTIPESAGFAADDEETRKTAARDVIAKAREAGTIEETTATNMLAAIDASVGDHPRAEDCPIGECEVCAVRDCPWDEPLHHHHDGCPACVGGTCEECGSKLSDLEISAEAKFCGACTCSKCLVDDTGELVPCPDHWEPLHGTPLADDA